MKRVIAIILLFVSAIAIAGPIEDAVAEKAVEIELILATLTGWLAQMYVQYVNEQITAVELLDALEQIAFALQGGAEDLGVFVQNIKNQI